MNLCRACGEEFGGVTLFDKHRVGTHAYTAQEGEQFSPPASDGRRCLSVEEMCARGWARNGLARWTDSVHVPGTRKAWSAAVGPAAGGRGGEVPA